MPAMIVAGIDEAGYGPLLGPLVVGCCAFEVEPDADGAVPCLWGRLRKHVSRNRLKSGRKIHVNDSKLVYSAGSGLKELERSVLASTAAMGEAGDWPGDLDGFLSRVASPAADDAAGYVWYQPPPGEKFPLEQDALPVQLFSKALRAEAERAKARPVHLGARVVFERQLNQMFEATRNKANVLFSTAAVHLDHLLRKFGTRDLTIFCDRQGGRGHYGSLLRLMFPDWSLEIAGEEAARSDYVLRRPCRKRARRPHHFRREGRGPVPARGGRVHAQQVPPRSHDAAVQRVVATTPPRSCTHRGILRRRDAVPRRHRPQTPGIGRGRPGPDSFEMT